MISRINDLANWHVALKLELFGRNGELEVVIVICVLEVHCFSRRWKEALCTDSEGLIVASFCSHGTGAADGAQADSASIVLDSGGFNPLILGPIPPGGTDAVEGRFDKPFLRSSKQRSEPGDVAPERLRRRRATIAVPCRATPVATSTGWLTARSSAQHGPEYRGSLTGWTPGPTCRHLRIRIRL